MPAGFRVLGERIDFVSHSLDAIVEAAPVLSQILQDANHPRCQDICALGTDVRQCVAQPVEPLPSPH